MAAIGANDKNSGTRENYIIWITGWGAHTLFPYYSGSEKILYH
jgi:hypothetical protein